MTKARILQIISLLLAMITLAFAVSCGASSCSCKGNTGNTTPADPDSSDDREQDVQFESQKPTVEKHTNGYGIITEENIFGKDLDFKEEEICILYRDNIQNSREWFKEESEDELNSVIVEACSENWLNANVVLKPIPSNGIGNDFTEYKSRFHNKLIDDVLSERHEYDISANMACYTASPVIRSYAANLCDSERFPYLNFSNRYISFEYGWYQPFIKETTINGKLFYLTTNMNTSVFDATPVVWYNHTLYRELREDSDPESPQETVLNGKWTYDELYRWTSASYEVFDGIGLVLNKKDQAPLSSIPHAWDLDFIVTNSNRSHSFNIKGNEKVTDAFEKLVALLDCENTSTDATIESFVEGRALFYMDVVCRSPEDYRALQDMEDSHSLLPMPKYDANQTEYFSTPEDFYTLMLVPDHKSDTGGELVSAFLFLVIHNSSHFDSEYYVQTVDPEEWYVDHEEYRDYPQKHSPAYAFDIWSFYIIEGIRLDFASVYSPQLNDLSYLWKEAIESEKSPEQVFDDYKNTFETALKDTDEWLNP